MVALTRMLANPKILEETGVRVVWPSIFAQFPNFWPSCCWTIPKKTGNWCINEIYFKIYEICLKIYEIYLKIVQIFSHQVCICPSFADTNIIREGMEVILQWRPPSFLILIILLTNYKSGDFCVIWDNLGKRPTLAAIYHTNFALEKQFQDQQSKIRLC